MQDLRDFIAAAEARGELHHIRGAHWDQEIGTLAQIARKEMDPPPALLFDEIVGYPPGYRVLTGIFSSISRLRLALGVPDSTTPIEFVRWCREKMKSPALLPPEWVADGPLLENVMSGDGINLLSFPSPVWNEGDGGRYIGTACTVITQDPEDGTVNLGTYRVMVVDEKRLTIWIAPGKHARIHRQKYYAAKRPFPVAITFGQDPLLFLVGCIAVNYTVPEYDLAGYLKGAPIEVIRGEYTGLPIPARAEIVVEGEMWPGEEAPEGPFGEWTGYYASGQRPCPLVRVHRVYHRDNPIITGAPPFRPPGDATLHVGLVRSGLIWDALEAAGVPDVHGVWCFEMGGNRLLTAVSIKQRYPGHARQAGAIATQCRAAAYLGRYTVVVDEDIDPSNINDVMWAMATRSDPETSIEILRRCWSSPLDPMLPPSRHGESMNSRAIIDACRPFEWKDQFPPVVGMNADVRARVLARWGAQLQGHPAGRGISVR